MAAIASTKHFSLFNENTEERACYVKKHTVQAACVIKCTLKFENCCEIRHIPCPHNEK